VGGVGGNYSDGVFVLMGLGMKISLKNALSERGGDGPTFGNRPTGLLARIARRPGLWQSRSMDWRDCDEIEAVPGKVGGRPAIKGTRVEPDSIVLDAEMGATPEETHESFPHIPVETIRRTLEFASKHQPVS
jgi:uncharacterized protein (DUF433 family)